MAKLNISIPQPCHENWDAMKPEDRGRFCDSCQKNVIDFTKASDQEIVNAFQKDNNLCGRFLNTQLNRDLIKPEKKSPVWLAAVTAFISLIGLNEISAQEPVKTGQTPIDKERALGKFIVTKPTEQIEEIYISGVILDKMGPMPGANITIKGTDAGVQTDFDGKFSIKAHINDTLVIQYVGYETKEIEVKNQDKIEVIIKEKAFFMGEVVYEKKRTFFGRIFHRIGNLFR